MAVAGDGEKKKLWNLNIHGSLKPELMAHAD